MSPSELRDVLSSMGIHVNGADAQTMIESADLDGDGDISFPGPT